MAYNRRKRKAKKDIVVGEAHIHSTFNNTIVTITDEDGTEFVKYLPFMKTLSDKGMEIGNILFND